jgi:hypothetical protein
MRRPQGYLTITSDRHVERDTITCGHCGRIVVVKPNTATTVYLLPQRDGTWREEPGAGCRVCMQPVCLACHDVGTCRPVEQWLELMESARGGLVS